MAEAQDAQMQAWGDNRYRPRAESARDLLIALRDDKALIEDVYNRASNGEWAWEDARVDVPQKLLSANMLHHNTFATLMIQLFDQSGESTNDKAALVDQIRGIWPEVLTACVRPAAG